jgi:hypothetical protein
MLIFAHAAFTPLLSNTDATALDAEQPQPSDELESAMREVLDDPDADEKTKARIKRALNAFRGTK